MSNNTALVKQESNYAVAYGPEQIQLIKDVYAKGASDTELALFIEVAQRKGLDIFSRQIHLVKRYDSQLQKTVMEPQTGIDGYRLMAERTGKYEGQLGPFWCGADGEWKDVWLSSDPPAAAKVGTLKAGCREPFWAVALYKEYVQFNKSGEPNAMWKKMAANQLAKCAEALSLRKAFPGDLAGIYTQEEMAQASNPVVIDVTPEPITDAQREELKSIITDLRKLGVTNEQLAEGIANLTSGRVDNTADLTNEEAAKVINGFGKRLEEKRAEAKRKQAASHEAAAKEAMPPITWSEAGPLIEA